MVLWGRKLKEFTGPIACDDVNKFTDTEHGNDRGSIYVNGKVLIRI
jgi:hypothetical protein